MGGFSLKTILRTITMSFVFLFFFNTFTYAQAANELYQFSTINALLQGVYDGELTIKDLKKQGSFGIGTLNGLDGELIGLDGDYYQVKANGDVLKLTDDAKIPFATSLTFKSDRAAQLHDSDYENLQKSLDQMKNDTNYFYAIRIDGVFTKVLTRAIPKQDRPYKPLAEAAKEQHVFELNNINGTVIGFWCPQYINGINVPGYHLHFISEDRKFGGHILTAALQAGNVQMSRIHAFRMELPQGASGFGAAALNKDYSKELKAIEQ